MLVMISEVCMYEIARFKHRPARLLHYVLMPFAVLSDPNLVFFSPIQPGFCQCDPIQFDPDFVNGPVIVYKATSMLVVMISEVYM